MINHAMNLKELLWLLDFGLFFPEKSSRWNWTTQLLAEFTWPFFHSVDYAEPDGEVRFGDLAGCYDSIFKLLMKFISTLFARYWNQNCNSIMFFSSSSIILNENTQTCTWTCTSSTWKYRINTFEFNLSVFHFLNHSRTQVYRSAFDKLAFWLLIRDQNEKRDEKTSIPVRFNNACSTELMLSMYHLNINYINN